MMPTWAPWIIHGTSPRNLRGHNSSSSSSLETPYLINESYPRNPRGRISSFRLLGPELRLSALSIGHLHEKGGLGFRLCRSVVSNFNRAPFWVLQAPVSENQMASYCIENRNLILLAFQQSASRTGHSQWSSESSNDAIDIINFLICENFCYPHGPGTISGITSVVRPYSTLASSLVAVSQQIW